MVTKYVPVTNPEGRERRLRAFRHNSYMGFVTMTERQMMTIIGADTTTTEAKHHAQSILDQCIDLKHELRNRVDN